jgi:hypothetical protein
MEWAGIIIRIAALIAFVAFFVWAWRQLRRRGIGLREAWMGKQYVVEVEGDAGPLCKRAMLEVAGSRTWKKFNRRRTSMFTHLPGERAASAAVQFDLEPLGDGRTRVTLAVSGGGQSGAEMNVEHAEKRAELGERLAQWLTEHGNGRRVRHTG